MVPILKNVSHVQRSRRLQCQVLSPHMCVWRGGTRALTQGKELALLVFRIIQSPTSSCEITLIHTHTESSLWKIIRECPI